MAANGFASISRWSDQNGILTLEARRWVESVSNGQLHSYAVADLPSASVAGMVVWTTDGNAGAACPAISDGTNWKKIALGATVSAS